MANQLAAADVRDSLEKIQYDVHEIKDMLAFHTNYEKRLENGLVRLPQKKYYNRKTQKNVENQKMAKTRLRELINQVRKENPKMSLIIALKEARKRQNAEASNNSDNLFNVEELEVAEELDPIEINGTVYYIDSSDMLYEADTLGNSVNPIPIGKYNRSTGEIKGGRRRRSKTRKGKKRSYRKKARR